MLHDSFGTTYREYLAGDVKDFTAIGTYGFPTDWLTAYRPDVVVQLFAERSLMAKSFAFR